MGEIITNTNEMSNEELWQAALGELELSISKASFTTWFKNTYISSIEADNVVVGVPNNFTKSWLEKKFNENIKKTLQKLTNQPISEIIYKIEKNFNLNTNVVLSKELQLPQTNEVQKMEAPQKRENLNKFGLNHKYIFETFIVGKGNELAHAACQAVAAQPGKAYNPLFIYGGVGLGKTHLLHAVGHKMLKKNPEAKILYVTFEKFTNDFINSVKKGQNPREFKDKYRNVDLLLIDDIQFITGKEQTQDEFFHTFNALHQSDKQIILSSDRPPKEIKGLEQRLQSRFEWGMMADISSPDLETRIAILESKCQEKGYDLDKRILQYIALNIQNNIRELEGVLTKISAYHQLRNTPPSFEIIKNIVSGFSPTKNKRQTTTKGLILGVCNFYRLEMDELLGKTREKRIAEPRQMLMFLMREELKYSYPVIGKELGGKDHTTVLHACKKIKKRLEENIHAKQELENLRQSIYNSENEY